MALAPKFAGQKFTAAANPQTLHTLELYLDYVCPFSAKLFNTVYHSVFPLLSSPQYKDKVQFIFRQQIQPWHPSSTLVHEAGVAVLKLDPAKFWPFSDALFKEAKSFYDANIVNETRNQSYTRLSKIAASVGLPEQSFYDLLKISDKPAADGSLNTGNGVTNDLKVLVKFNRSQGIHVTPTVVFDGVVENSISSGWSAEQWKEWLEKNIV